MFNVAVVNVKDILKYLVSITITFFLVMFVTRFFSSLNENEKNKISQIMQTSLLVCLDEVIPGIKETNHELKDSEESLINENDILGDLLKIELAMFRKENEDEIQNSAINQTEENNLQENQNVEVSRRCYYTNCNRKSISR